jgi:hypothetical protein
VIHAVLHHAVWVIVAEGVYLPQLIAMCKDEKGLVGKGEALG